MTIPLVIDQQTTHRIIRSFEERFVDSGSRRGGSWLTDARRLGIPTQYFTRGNRESESKRAARERDG